MNEEQIIVTVSPFNSGNIEVNILFICTILNSLVIVVENGADNISYILPSKSVMSLEFKCSTKLKDINSKSCSLPAELSTTCTLASSSSSSLCSLINVVDNNTICSNFLVNAKMFDFLEVGLIVLIFDRNINSFAFNSSSNIGSFGYTISIIILFLFLIY